MGRVLWGAWTSVLISGHISESSTGNKLYIKHFASIKLHNRSRTGGDTLTGYNDYHIRQCLH